MTKLNQKQVALTLGTFLALMHLVWAILVAVGVAQSLVNWSIGLHMMSFQFTVGAFSLVSAIELIVVAFIIGSIVGFVFATIWNKFSE